MIVLTNSLTLFVVMLMSAVSYFAAVEASCASFPQNQFNALQDLYTSTNGDNWTWQSNTTGAIWNFSNPDTNPCADKWQGLNCTSTCILQGINLAEYNLTGTLPASLGAINTMRGFSVVNNHIYGSIPDTLSNWSAMVFFNVQNNSMTGTFPAFTITSWSRLNAISLGYNKFHGTLPNDIGSMAKLRQLNIRNNGMIGTIPNSITQLSALQYLYVKHNNFNGTIPENIGALQQALVLDFSSNAFVGTIPQSLTSLTQLLVFNAYVNALTGYIPAGINSMLSLQQFSVNTNNLIGSIPSVGDLAELNLFRVDNNELTGMIPDCFHNLTSLAIFNTTSNKLTGSLPSSLTHATSLLSFDVSDNELTGEVNNLFTGATQLQELVLYSNNFKGNIYQLIDPEAQLLLSSVDVSNNRFNGNIPSSIFQLKNLTLFAAAQNCFTGDLPNDICYANKTLQSLVLDGLHTQTSCVRNIFFGLNTYWTTNPVAGTIPACLMRDMSQLQLLHISGNALTGTLPDVEVSSQLQTLYLSHNHLSGSIPNSVQHHPWILLDLAFNRLSGTLSDDIYSFENTNSTLKLHENRLSGGIPSQLLDAPNIDILSSNMFECPNGDSSLPSHDPKANSYECGSDTTNDAIYTWIAFVLAIGMFVLVDYVCLRFNGPSFKVFRSYRKLLVQFQIWLQVFTSYDPDNTHLYEFGLTLKDIRWWTRGLTLAILFFFLPIYGALGSFYKTYTYPYAWTVSIAFLSGGPPAAIILVFMFLSLLFVYSPVNHYLMFNLFNVEERVKTELKKTISDYMEALMKSRDRQTSVGGNHNRDIEESIVRSTTMTSIPHSQTTQLPELQSELTANDVIDRGSVVMQPVKFTAEDAKTFYRWYTLVGALVVINVVAVLAINMAYVYALSLETINAVEKSFLSFAMSVFKISWAAVVIDPMYYYLRDELIKYKPTYEELLSKRGLLLPLMLWLSIFNSVVVPIIAVAFISADCFYYSIYPSSPVSAPVEYTGCTESVRSFTNGIGYYTVLGCAGDSRPYTVSYTPPFQYSFQCSSTLLSNFMDVYLYRYILGGAIIPIIMILLKVLQEYVLRKCGWDSYLFHIMSILIPRELRPMMNPPDEPKPEESSSKVVEANVDTIEEDPTQQPKSLRDQLRAQLSKSKLATEIQELNNKLKTLTLEDINKMLGLSPDSDVAFNLYSSIIVFSTDIAILLTFGVLFPPLAVLGCCTIYIRTYYMELTTGRLVHLAKEQPYLKAVIKSLNDECVGISKLMLSCLLSLPLLISLLWSFFIFDIWGDKVGYSPAYGAFFILPLIPLIILPLIGPTARKHLTPLIRKYCCASSAPLRATPAEDFTTDDLRSSQMELSYARWDGTQNPITSAPTR